MNLLPCRTVLPPAVAADVSRRMIPGGSGAMDRRTGSGLLARALLAWLLFLPGWASAAAADAGTNAPVYLRRTADANGVIALQVAARELIPERKNRPPVWLVGVIHLGTAGYYTELQEFLDARSLVLFEGIGAENGDFELQEDEFSLQDQMASALGLVFQLEAIDYRRPGFRNSDLSFDELARLFGGGGADGTAGTAPSAPGGAEFNVLIQMMRGEGFFGGLARMGVSALASSPRLQATMKVMLIEMMGGLPPNLAEIAGMPDGMKELMDKLIKARNDVVVRDVRRELRKRRRPDTIAVFYGAGHMADLEQRLCRELKLHPGEERWFTALSINPAAAGLSSFEVGMARSMSRLQLRALGETSSGKEHPTEAEAATPAGPSAE
ncbi:MAG: hypothetical protein KDM81_04370 [Verrucomicrobiae bacterium]|nr:hypothetical protein [Verrucomicrobiae bacterium]